LVQSLFIPTKYELGKVKCKKLAAGVVVLTRAANREVKQGREERNTCGPGCSA
jgi:hypothetical protein